MDKVQEFKGYLENKAFGIKRMDFEGMVEGYRLKVLFASFDNEQKRKGFGFTHEPERGIDVFELYNLANARMNEQFT